MKYISLFSGVGGLESATTAPVLCCDTDLACWPVLARRFPEAALHDDIRTLAPPAADAVAGGWPCQDISVAGYQRGLEEGERSSLFFRLVEVAQLAGAHTIVAENVPNLLTLDAGNAFWLVIRTLVAAGFPHVAWRVLDARAFGLPHQRRRVFLVASRHPELARALHRPLPDQVLADDPGEACAGFYWTAGLQSICYSAGYVPTLKVGSSLSIPSPPAVHFGDVVRKATADECLRLQGLDPADFTGVRPSDRYRMAGNAVPGPVGRFVMASLDGGRAPDGVQTPATDGPAGLYDGTNGTVRRFDHPAPTLATNLGAFIDRTDRELMSARAAAGLLTRLARSGKPCPLELRALLARCVDERAS